MAAQTYLETEMNSQFEGDINAKEKIIEGNDESEQKTTRIIQRNSIKKKHLKEMLNII